MKHYAHIGGALVLGTALAWGAAAQAGVPPEVARHQIDEIVDGAETAGLPGERLRTKAQEGLAKGVAPERIVAVLAAMRQQMQDMATLLDRNTRRKLPPPMRRQLIDTLSQARQLGVAPDALSTLCASELGEHPAPARLDAAVTALGDLVAQGYDAKGSLRLVELALSRGLGAPDFARLVSAVQEARGRVEPGVALQAIYHAVAAAKRPAWLDTPAADPTSAGGPLDIHTPAAAHKKVKPPPTLPPPAERP